MNGCNSAGEIINETPIIKDQVDTWLWAYRFNGTYHYPDDWKGRGFIGWLSKILAPLEDEFLIDVIKTAIEYDKSLPEAIEYTIVTSSIYSEGYWRYYIYYDYIYGNTRFNIIADYCEKQNCRWMLYRGDYSVYIDPSLENQLVSYVLKYLENNYPIIYDTIVSNSNIELIIDKDKWNLELGLQGYTILLKDRGNFTITTRVFFDYETNKFIFNGLTINIPDLTKHSTSISEWINLINKIKLEYLKSMDRARRLGFQLKLDNNYTSKQEEMELYLSSYTILYNGKYIGFLTRNEQGEVSSGLIKAYLKYVYDYSSISITYYNDLELLEHIYKKLGGIKIKPSISREKAANIVYEKLKPKYGDEISREKILNNLIEKYVITSGGVIKLYSIELYLRNGKVYEEFVINGSNGEILSYDIGMIIEPIDDANKNSTRRPNTINPMIYIVFISVIALILGIIMLSRSIKDKDILRI
ncbi:MAG: hypothetical protein B6U89_00350 [Desulfurococcales archaeon ex4484_58]|nr:MAG: hypothetical protein B6U89_00350 [Desulfurococcales archaeon ex4484_58]